MRPNLRSNRNQIPRKLVDTDPAPAQPKQPKKQSKRKPIRRNAPAKAPTVAEEVVDAAEQLVALQRFSRALNRVTKPVERARSRRFVSGYTIGRLIGRVHNSGKQLYSLLGRVI
jgi:hypothetical protein